MERKPDFDRFREAVLYQEPDWVPLVELIVDLNHQSAMLGREVAPDDLKSQVDFWASAGYDFIPLTTGLMQPGEVTKESQVVKIVEHVLQDEVAPSGKKSAWTIETKGVITNFDEFEQFPWMDAAQLDYGVFEEVQQYLLPGMKIIAQTGKIFTLTWMLMGFQHFCSCIIENEELVEKVFAKVGEIQLKSLERILEFENIGAAWGVDDLAFKFGLMLSPEQFRKFVFPWYRDMVNVCHEKDALFVFHSDGDLTKLLDDFIGIGLDALHPIDPSAMDINKTKDYLHKKMAIMGNISLDTLTRGTTDDVVELTKKRIRELAPGGGYIVASANSIPDWVKFENYKAMLDTTLEFGRYPIKG
jgi:uroporphyrinogen decarboxylase